MPDMRMCRAEPGSHWLGQEGDKGRPVAARWTKRSAPPKAAAHVAMQAKSVSNPCGTSARFTRMHCAGYCVPPSWRDNGNTRPSGQTAARHPPAPSPAIAATIATGTTA